MARKKRKAAPRPQVRYSGAEFQISPAALRFAVPALVVLLSIFAWTQRGVYEDGFFYLRVVNVFLHSGDLSYNPGEYYETNTDFLWSLLLIPGPAAGVDPILWMHLVGVAVYAAALWTTYALARRLFPDSDGALVALVLLGGHFSFAHFAATGFGTILQALAAACCLLALFEFGKAPNPRNGAALGFALLSLALCRLDSAIMGIPLVLCALFFAWRGGKAALPAIGVAMGIPAILLGGILLWKLSYYGDVFPTPYYVKAETSGGRNISFFFERGAAYLAVYWQRYFLWMLAGIVIFGAWRARKTAGKRSKKPPCPRFALLWTAAAMSALHHAYMLRAGGDVYEFRLLMPQVVPMMILAAGGLRGVAQNWRWAAVAGTIALSVLHWQTAPDWIPVGEKKIEPGYGYGADVMHSAGLALMGTRVVFDGGLREEVREDALEEVYLGWYFPALALRDLFAPLGKYPPDVRVAHGAGGIMSYHAPLLWTEMYGWADPRIARAAPEDVWDMGRSTVLPVLARPELLARLGVNLVVQFGVDNVRPDFSRPRFRHDNPRFTWAYYISQSQHPAVQFPPDSQLFFLPLQNGKFFSVLYFNRNKTIDRILDERGIERVNVF